MFSAINRKVKRFVLRQQKKKPLVLISDTTLRDGAQMPGVRLTQPGRIAIARALAQAGVHSIDVGFPAANEAEVEAIRAVARSVKGPVLSVLARTLKSDVDLACAALGDLSPLKRSISLFIGTSPVHRRDKHALSKAQIIKTAVEAILYAEKFFEIITFGPEDASRTEPDFLHEVYKEAIAAGAINIGFTDTVGILTPDQAADAVKRIQDCVPNMDDAMLSVHFHDDLGLATANALACVKAGVNIVQGTVNGIGERAGNMPIEEFVLAMTLHATEFGKQVTLDPRSLAGLSRLVAELTGVAPAPNKAVVGENIFRTESGIHQDGLLKNPETYLPFQPELTGAGPIELVLGRNSGRNAVRHHLRAAGMKVTEEHVQLVLDYIKGKQHNSEDYAEIEEFLQRLNPYMATEEDLARHAFAPQPDGDSPADAADPPPRARADAGM